MSPFVSKVFAGIVNTARSVLPVPTVPDWVTSVNILTNFAIVSVIVQLINSAPRVPFVLSIKTDFKQTRISGVICPNRLTKSVNISVAVLKSVPSSKIAIGLNSEGLVKIF